MKFIVTVAKDKDIIRRRIFRLYSNIVIVYLMIHRFPSQSSRTPAFPFVTMTTPSPQIRSHKHKFTHGLAICPLGLPGSFEPFNMVFGVLVLPEEDDVAPACDHGVPMSQCPNVCPDQTEA